MCKSNAKCCCYYSSSARRKFLSQYIIGLLYHIYLTGWHRGSTLPFEMSYLGSIPGLIINYGIKLFNVAEKQEFRDTLERIRMVELEEML